MSYFVLFIGIAIVALGFLLVIQPTAVLDYFRDSVESLEFQIVSVILSIVFGIVFISYSPSSKFPTALTVIGLISISKGVLRTLIGQADFKDLMAWYFTFLSPFARAIGVIEILFGYFLVLSTL